MLLLVVVTAFCVNIITSYHQMCISLDNYQRDIEYFQSKTVVFSSQDKQNGQRLPQA